jgi:predicted MFS family arabinose efflux permease
LATGRIERRRLLTATLAVLAITVLQMSGQFTIFTFMGPLLKQLTGAGADAIGLVFALHGGFGFVGS